MSGNARNVKVHGGIARRNREAKRIIIKEGKVKKLVNVTEVEGEGLLGLMGERVTFFCLNYIYTGKLTGVNDSEVLLEDASIVYETGEFTSPDWKDAQKLPHPIYVRLSCVESYMKLK